MSAEELEPEDLLLRDVPLKQGLLEWDGRQQRWIPALAAMSFDPDGLSTFVERILLRGGHSIEDVTTRGGVVDRDSVVYAVRNDEVLKSYDTAHTPNEETPIGYAHSSIIKKAGMGKSEHRRARIGLAPQMECVYGDVPFSPPPGQG